THVTLVRGGPPRELVEYLLRFRPPAGRRIGAPEHLQDRRAGIDRPGLFKRGDRLVESLQLFERQSQVRVRRPVPRVKLDGLPRLLVGALELPRAVVNP